VLGVAGEPRVLELDADGILVAGRSPEGWKVPEGDVLDGAERLVPISCPFVS
jgi:hypothetical protein